MSKIQETTKSLLRKSFGLKYISLILWEIPTDLLNVVPKTSTL